MDQASADDLASDDARPTVVGTAPAARPVPGSTTPVVTVVSLLGAALTGLFLLTADRWAPTGAARVFAVVAVVAVLLAVVVAVLGQLLAAGAGPARLGWTMVLAGGALSVLAVLSGGAAALLVPRPATAGAGPQPSVSVLLSGAPEARTVLVKMVFPDLAAGSQVDATLVGIETDDGGGTSRTLLARSLARTGGPGPATVELTAAMGDHVRNATATGTVGGRSCTATFAVFDEGTPALRCRG